MAFGKAYLPRGTISRDKRNGCFILCGFHCNCTSGRIGAGSRSTVSVS